VTSCSPVAQLRTILRSLPPDYEKIFEDVVSMLEQIMTAVQWRLVCFLPDSRPPSAKSLNPYGVNAGSSAVRLLSRQVTDASSFSRTNSGIVPCAWTALSANRFALATCP
jgi:hypothetical protein